MNLDALSGTGVYAKELGGVAAAPSAFVEATIATTPGSVDDEVMVLVGAEGSQLQAGPCRWEPRTGGQPWPKRDDPCLVVTGDKGHRAIVWWKPAVPVALGIPRVTSLPVAPVDGQEIIYVADAAKGVLWHLKYNASSASIYRWEVVGASKLYAEFNTADNGTASTTYVSLTNDPTVTVPLAGDYDIDFGAYCYGDSATARATFMSIDSGTAANDFEAVPWLVTSGVGQGPGSRRIGRTGVAASTVIRPKFRTVSATSFWTRRWLAVTPVRVG